MTLHPAIQLRPVTSENWEDVCRLKVAEGQKNFVASNAHSLAMAAYVPGLYPLAIYDEHGDLVGFIMYGWWEENPGWWIARVMVDERHQCRGYGRVAIEIVAGRVKHDHSGEAVNLSVESENKGAITLYESLGFKATGEKFGDQIVMRKPLAE
jgi:diamine N-acetyltransferase